MNPTVNNYNNMIPIKSRRHIDFVQEQSILFLEASNNYCFIHLKDGNKKIVSNCMKHMLSLVNSGRFLKIHRKFAINVDHIRSLDIANSNIILASGAQVSISRSNKKKVKDWFLNKSSQKLKTA